MNKRQWIADSALLLVTAIWGATFVTVKDAVSDFPVFTFLAIRFGLALIALLPFIALRRRSPERRHTGPLGPTLGAGIVIGLALFAGYAFQTFGLRLTTPAKTGFITGLSVVLVPLISALALRRPPERHAALGVLLATLGLGLLSLRGDLQLVAGDLIVLACAVGFALHIVILGHFAPRLDSLALVVLQIATVAVLSLAASLIFEGPWPAIPRSVWIAAGFTGLAATTLAFAIQTIAQRFTTPTHTALIFAMEPVWAGLFSYWLINERLGPRELAGCGLILAGMLVTELAPWLRLGRARLVAHAQERAEARTTNG